MRRTVRLLALMLVLALLFSGCGMLNIKLAWPEPTEPQLVESLPPESTEPAPTEPAPTEPEPTEPAPTEPEPTEPPTTNPIQIGPEGELFSVTREGHYIFDEPSFDGGCVQGMPTGIFTIIETARDDEGNTWGRLKSGMGWICLTEIVWAQEEALPVAMVEAYPELLKDDNVDIVELPTGEYYYKLAFFAYEKLTDVKLSLVDVFGEEPTQKDLKWEQDSLNPQRPVVLHLEFSGDFTTYELTCLDASGTARAFRIMQSGRNGVISMWEVQ